MKRPLGEILLEEGIINQEELNEILKIKEKSQLKIGQILQKKGIATENDILKVIAKQYGYEFFPKLEFKNSEVFKRLPLNYIEKYKIVPFEYVEKKRLIRFAISNPENIHFQDDIRNHFKDYRVEFVLAPESEVLRIFHTHFQKVDASDVVEGLEEEYSEFAQMEDTLDLANEAPIIRMVNAILSQAVQERASDIHIEPFEKNFVVRFRIDGILHKRMTPPKVIHSGVVSRIKIMANLNIAENRLPQDGRIKLKLTGKEIDIRVSTLPTKYGEKIVMRLLNKSDIEFHLYNLGLYDDILREIKKIIAQPNGIVLVTGPTGSGKSTTLYSILKELNKESVNIMTVEDPIEYELEGVSQTQVHEKIGLTFANVLRTMLRQDPDIIMVGEIRDQETARIAIQAALTGHLVLSTLHTNDAPSAITRLVDMGIEPYLITSSVRAVIAQRLVRVICPKCKVSYSPPVEELMDLGLDPTKQKRLYRGEGCEHCVHTGYYGRTGIYEFMKITPAIQRAILKGHDAETLKEVALKEGMITLFEYGKRKILDGITTPEEVLRVC
ncbi:MAG: type II secretion system ATPase GspE [Leptospiraceae bacterium]|nr:type II secretion system ATPase GspE [Leptospiraceae bacterium]MDW7975731.1 type II secretion system ATPase GspE [Leptospiraceae bacterium]